MAAINLKASSKCVTILVIVAVVILFGCALIYVGAAGKLKSAVNEMDAKAKQVNESRQIAQELEQSKLQYLDARSQVRYLEASVSTQEYVPTLLKQIERLGKSVDLKVVAVRPVPIVAKPAMHRSLASGKQAAEGNVDAASQDQPDGKGGKSKKQKPPPYDELKIGLEAEGRYMNVLDFLYKLTSFPKIIAVNEIELAPPGNRLQAFASPTLNIKLNVTAFVLKNEAPSGPPAHEPAKSRARVTRKEVAGSEAG